MLHDTLWFFASLVVPILVGLLASAYKRRQGYYEWYVQKFGVKAGIIASIIMMVTVRVV